MTIVSGAVNTNTGPPNRQKLDIGRGSKVTELGIPVVKRSKHKKTTKRVI